MILYAAGAVVLLTLLNMLGVVLGKAAQNLLTVIKLLGLLAIIDFSWSAAVMVLERQDFQSWAAALVRKMMTIGVFYALLIYGRQWIPAITDSFETLGQHASGGGPLSPSDVFVRGLNIAGALIDGATSTGVSKTSVALWRSW